MLAAKHAFHIAYGESDTDRLNPSAWVTLSRSLHEVSLTLWSSGDAELVFGVVGQDPAQEHIEVADGAALERLLERLLVLIT